MSNVELIANEAKQKGIPYNGNNLRTFAQWKKSGYIVKAGEKAVLNVQLWKNVMYRDKETEEIYSKFIKTEKCYLFSESQVKPITVH